MHELVKLNRITFFASTITSFVFYKILQNMNVEFYRSIYSALIACIFISVITYLLAINLNLVKIPKTSPPDIIKNSLLNPIIPVCIIIILITLYFHTTTEIQTLSKSKPIKKATESECISKFNEYLQYDTYIVPESLESCKTIISSYVANYKTSYTLDGKALSIGDKIASLSGAFISSDKEEVIGGEIYTLRIKTASSNTIRLYFGSKEAQLSALNEIKNTLK